MRNRTSYVMWVAGIVFGIVCALQLGTVERARAQSDAKAMYKAAQEKLNDERYREAADAFEQVFKKHKSSEYAGDAMYWYAFSLYRLGGRSNLRDATRALETQMETYDDADSENDARSLYYRILGQRARDGDEEAARKLQSAREDLGEIGSDMDTKLAAMDALLNMREDRALPILKSVMEDRRPESNKLREKAVFLLSQQDSYDATVLLMEAAKSDPDRSVREQAIFWLSEVDSEEAMDFLLDAVNTLDDPEIRKKAVFAISQRGGERASKALKNIALDDNADHEVREQAIFWLGEMNRPDDTQFLMDLYGPMKNEDLKDKVIFAISQRGDAASAQWLLTIAKDKNESVEMRKQALFWAGESGALDANALVDVYRGSKEREFQEQVIFVLSQREGSLDAMMKLARSEKDPDLRKKLIFWIGQSDDPRAVEFLTRIINE